MAAIDVKKLAIVMSVLMIVALSSMMLKLNKIQVLTLTAFVTTISAALVYWRLNLPVGLIGLASVFAVGVLDIDTFAKYAHFDIIVFILGLMIITSYLEECGLFKYYVIHLIRLIGKRAYAVLSALVYMSAIFGMFVGEEATIVFMSIIAVELSLLYRLNVIKLVLALSFAATIGSTGAVMGSPVSLLIAFEGELTMMDFFKWATPIMVMSITIFILLSKLYIGDVVADLKEGLKEVSEEELIRLLPLMPRARLIGLSAFFASIILGIVLHSQISEFLNSLGVPASPHSVLVAISILAAGVILVTSYTKAYDFVVHKVDWWTLSFFMVIFSLAGSLKESGIASVIVESIVSFTGTHEASIFLTLSAFTALLSPFADNVTIVAAISPIVKGFGEYGVDIYPIWWALLFSGVYSGLVTPLGTTAGILTMGVIEKRKLGEMSIKYWMKYGITVSALIIPLSLAITYVRAFLL